MTVLVADEGLLGLAELVPSYCEIRWYSGRDIPPTLLEGADALLVRSTVRLAAHQLPESIRLIGTATIGTDHLPLAALALSGVWRFTQPLDVTHLLSRIMCFLI